MNRIYFLLALLAIIACNETPKKQSKQSSDTNTQAYKPVAPLFNPDSAFNFTQTQVNFGPRVTGTSQHKLCGNWIVNKFKEFGATVVEQKASVTNWDNKKLSIRNIIASTNTGAKNRVLICAHWDSRPYADQDPDPANHNKPVLAADDGASGVAVMLEMARVIQLNQPNIGVDFICFDAEDLGKPEYDNSYCLGSQYWGANLHQPGYKANFGVLLDMVGASGAKFVWEEVSIKYAEPILRMVWDKAIQLGYSNYFFYYKKGGITDDHYYVNKLTGIPTIDIIHYRDNSPTGFPAHWHTVNDNMQVIDRNTLKAVGQTLLEVIYTQPK